MKQINIYIKEAIITNDITEDDIAAVISVNSIKRILESSKQKILVGRNLVIKKLKDIDLSYYSKIISDQQIEILVEILNALDKKLSRLLHIYLYIADDNKIIGFKYTNDDPVKETQHFVIVRPTHADASCVKDQILKIDFNIASEKISDYIVKAVNKIS